MRIATILFLGYLLLFPLLTFSQAPGKQLSTKKKKAVEYYKEAETNYARRNYTDAMEAYQEAINKDKDFVEAYLRLGAVYRILGDNISARRYWKDAEMAAVRIKRPNDFPLIFYYLGELELEKGAYTAAESYFDRYIVNPKVDPRNRTRAMLLMDQARYAIIEMQNPIDFNPTPVPGYLNRFALQYFPVLTADQKQLYFTRRIGFNYNDDEDIHVSTLNEDGVWEKSVSISEKINTPYNEGTCSVTADGRTIIFTSCEGRVSFGSCDLFISYKEGENWSEPENLGSVINTNYWESQPSLSADGKTLFFVSDRPGGFGKRDIWVSNWKEGEWSKPENLGNSINTPEDEVSPFIHVNNQTLYFASRGHLGFGSFDIYVTEKIRSGWKDPENLGYPLNDFNEQTSLFITSDGKKGYYSNETKGNNRSSMIYVFDVPPQIRVTNTSTYVKGVVSDSKTKEPLKAQIELYDLNTEEKVFEYESDSLNGKYLMILTEGSDYALYTSANGYLFKSEYFSYSNSNLNRKPIEVDIALDPIEKGISTRLSNIFFETDKYELTDRSKVELNKVVNFMNSNADIQVAIDGHTDNVGGEAYNKELSTQRARAVYDFLIGAGIEESRLASEGFGSSQPVSDNDTDEGRAMNRRIEFRILN